VSQHVVGFANTSTFDIALIVIVNAATQFFLTTKKTVVFAHCIQMEIVLQQHVQKFNSSLQSQLQQHRESVNVKHTTKVQKQNVTTLQ